MTGQPQTGMTADERYAATLQALITCASHVYRIAELVDLGELQQHLDTCEILAPILEPTAYNDGGRLLIAEQRTFLQATITYVQALRGLERMPT
ncbi:hypothetical protein ACGFIV_00855 [Sphaerisporangium sp. NPDC049003]|uniref:hypothetical protein n=1 Tax=Sphaerisporangium sp. NPDC049003 TaxID=3364517 RepID=UPI00371C1587